MNKLKYNCGCEFEIIAEKKGKFPRLKFDYYKDFKEDCPKVWELFSVPLTLGIFQVDSQYAQKWCQELKPTCIEHLAALGALLRPGCIGSNLEDGKSLTEHYCLRKNGKEPTEYPIKALEPILNKTYGILVFQEQQLRIGQEIAGFNASDSDYYLRKAVGKKDAKLLLSVESKFLEGCKKVGKVNEEEAKTIFGWIKSAARYSFNLSHALQFGLRGFFEMYLKAHFSLNFFVSKLKSPRNSQNAEDNANLIYDAKTFGINTNLPDLRHMRPEFYHDGKEIYFGLSNIKWFGDSGFRELKEIWKKFGGEKKFAPDFFEFCINSSRHLSPSSVQLLIEAGAADYFGKPRLQMLEEFKLINELTGKEKEHLFKYYDALKAGVFDGEK